MVSIQFIGSGDAFGSGGRFQTCIRLTHQTGSLLIDCGASSLVALKRAGVPPASIDAILLSHLHGDHFGGVPFFILDAQFGDYQTLASHRAELRCKRMILTHLSEAVLARAGELAHQGAELVADGLTLDL